MNALVKYKKYSLRTQSGCLRWDFSKFLYKANALRKVQPIQIRAKDFSNCQSRRNIKFLSQRNIKFLTTIKDLLEYLRIAPIIFTGRYPQVDTIHTWV